MNTKMNLCGSCRHSIPECGLPEVKFGDGVGNDNVISCNKYSIKEIEELTNDGKLCEYCTCTDFGSISVNTGPHNLCEGRGCDDAYARYKEDIEDKNALTGIVLTDSDIKTLSKSMCVDCQFDDCQDETGKDQCWRTMKKFLEGKQTKC